MLDLSQDHDEARLVMCNGFDGGIEMLTADTVVLATGYSFAMPECLSPLKERPATFQYDGLDRQTAASLRSMPVV